MKKNHIVGILLIAVAISAMVVSLADTSSYASFDEAKAYPDREYHVIGEFAPDKQITYNPLENPNFFSFYMEDKKGGINRVIHHDAMPQDFKMSDEIVIVGHMQGDDFLAKDILMKCPSKYEDEFVQADKASE